MFLSADQVSGNLVNMLRNNALHLETPGKQQESIDVEKSFSDVLLNAFNDVNNSELSASELSELMIIDPDSVNVHDVTIAGAEATMALSITKAVVDKALAAYKEIINTR